MIGLIIPILFLIFAYFNPNFVAGDGTVFIWPSSILLMSTDGSEHTAFAYQVMAISILINVLLYSIFGLLLFFISKLIRR